MSLVPWGWNRDPFWDRPSRLWDIDRPSKYWDIDYPSRFWERPSRFWELDDWINREFSSLVKAPEFVKRSLSPVFNDSGARVGYNPDNSNFEASVDVDQFAPHEISVKTTGNTITVEAKHEENKDGHSYISKNMVRKFVLPETHDVNQAISNLSSDGVLTITAPKIYKPSIENRHVPIIRTGRPSKAIEHKKVNF